MTGARAFWSCKDGRINFEGRGFWQDVPVRPGATVRYPGGFAVVDGQRLAIRRPPPAVGEHKDEVHGHLLAPGARSRSPLGGGATP